MSMKRPVVLRHVRLITTQLRNGQLFYMIAVAPQNEREFR